MRRAGSQPLLIVNGSAVFSNIDTVGKLFTARPCEFLEGGAHGGMRGRVVPVIGKIARPTAIKNLADNHAMVSITIRHSLKADCARGRETLPADRHRRRLSSSRDT